MATDAEKYVFGQRVNFLTRVDDNMVQALDENLENLNKAIRIISRNISELVDKHEDQHEGDISESEIEYLSQLQDNLLFYQEEKKIVKK